MVLDAEKRPDGQLSAKQGDELGGSVQDGSPACTARPDSGSGCLERSGLSSLGSGSDCGGDLASAPGLWSRQSG